MMDYDNFCSIMNKHIFKDRKKELLRIIAEKEFYIGRFTLLKGDDILNECLQHLLQSHEIRMGDALEEIVEEILKDMGFTVLDKNMRNEKGETLSLDQYFMDGEIYYFIEQKIRDDHDSTKKRGQIGNFEDKLEVLHKKHNAHLIGLMYFIDPELSKNKGYYQEELKRLENFYGVRTMLFYGKELFDYFRAPEVWDNILVWLKQWKESLPELPEINFDACPEESFEEIKDIEIRCWRKILENERLWTDGVISAIFRDGKVLNMIREQFSSQKGVPYQRLSFMLEEKLRKYYPSTKEE